MRRGAAWLTAGLIATACAHGGASPQSIVDKASAATTTAGSAHVSVTVSGASTGSVTLNGVVDFANKAIDVSSPPSVGTKSETIVLGDTIFSLLPGVSSANGKPWLKVSRTALTPAVSSTPFAGLAQTTVDPEPLLAALPTSHHVTRVGADTVRGVAATHFVAALNSATAGTPGRADVWLDGQGRVVRLVTASGSSGATTTTTEFYDFGSPVHIVAPPADQVADLQTLLNPPSG